MGQLRMLLKNDVINDILANNVVDNNSAEQKAKQVLFRWPQHSFLIEQVKRNASHVSREMENNLKELELYQEESTTQNIEWRVAEAARRCSRNIKRKIWIRFDIFMAKGRPGLEGEGLVEEKGKKKNGKTEDTVESFTSLITSDCGVSVARAM